MTPGGEWTPDEPVPEPSAPPAAHPLPRPSGRTRWFVAGAGLVLVGLFGPALLARAVYTQPDRTPVVTAPLPAQSFQAPPADQGFPPAGVGSEPERLKPAVAATPSDPGAYAFTMTQADGTSPVGLDPCRPLHYVLRPHPGVPTDDTVVAEAVAGVSAATGLAFVDDGTKDEAPSRSRVAYQPERYGQRWAPILIAWSDPTEEPQLDGPAAGGLGQPIPWRAPSGAFTYVSGTIWLDTPTLAPLLDSADGRDAVRATVMHELGHVTGLAHVEDDSQLMYEGNTGTTSFQDGDRYGLSLVGRAPCTPDL